MVGEAYIYRTSNSIIFTSSPFLFLHLSNTWSLPSVLAVALSPNLHDVVSCIMSWGSSGKGVMYRLQPEPANHPFPLP